MKNKHSSNNIRLYFSLFCLGIPYALLNVLSTYFSVFSGFQFVAFVCFPMMLFVSKYVATTLKYMNRLLFILSFGSPTFGAFLLLGIVGGDPNSVILSFLWGGLVAYGAPYLGVLWAQKSMENNL